MLSKAKRRHLEAARQGVLHAHGWLGINENPRPCWPYFSSYQPKPSARCVISCWESGLIGWKSGYKANFDESAPMVLTDAGRRALEGSDD